jgi:hypothetical protein
MQVQVATKDTVTGEESIFTVVGSSTPAFYISWEIEGVIQQMTIDRPSAQMLAETLKRVCNIPEGSKAKTA